MAKKVYNNLKKKAEAQPLVGIFWLYKGQIIDFAKPVTDVPSVAGFVDSPYDHDAMWGQMTSLYPELKGQEYFSVPRGRITYLASGTFNMLLPSDLKNNKMAVQRIARRFNLPLAKVVPISDLHYDPPETDEDEET